MDVFKTHGAISWSELMTTDPAKAKQFYSKLFGWEMKDMSMATGNYSSAQVGETAVAGMMAMPPQAAGMPPSWGIYVTVTDIDATLKEVERLGGKAMVQPFDVPTVGRMAVIQDPQGAVLSIIKYSMGS